MAHLREDRGVRPGREGIAAAPEEDDAAPAGRTRRIPSWLGQRAGEG